MTGTTALDDEQDERQEEPLISVVIPTYNERDRIGNCLASVFAQQTEHQFEVIVVDSSEDDTVEVIRSQFPDVRTVRREQQTFPAEGRNIGIDIAQGDVVAFIDADCVAEEGWLEAVAQIQDERAVGIGGPVVLDSPATLAGATLFAIEFSEYGRGSPKRKIRWQPSCNLAVKRSAIEAYGNFPTDMQASEDMLFTRKLMEGSGMPLLFDPQMRIRHSNRNTWSQLKGKMENLGYWSGRSRATGLIPGGILLRFKFLVPLLVPYRLAKIVGRIVFRSRDTRLIAVGLIGWPLLIYGLAIWARSFMRGARAVV